MFCHEYTKDYNATQAAIRAGYSPKTARLTGNRLMQKDEVQAHVGVVQERINQAADITGELILKALWKNHETAESSGQLQHSNRALELLGKANRLFIDRVEQTVTIYEEMSDAELDTAIKQAQTEIDKHIH